MKLIFENVVINVLKELSVRGFSERGAKELCRSRIDFLEENYLTVPVDKIVEHIEKSTL